MNEYYAERAREYERIYDKPERQESLSALKARIRGLFAGKSVLELACGTGYWTRVISETAKRIDASDLSEETLAIARAKEYGACEVELSTGDAYAPVTREGLDAAFAGFWLSHVERSRRHGFVASVARALPSGSLVCMIDNLYVPGSSTPIARTDANGDSWQVRRLSDGREFEVIKNFPTREELESLAPSGERGYEEFRYYWLFSFRT